MNTFIAPKSNIQQINVVRDSQLVQVSELLSSHCDSLLCQNVFDTSIRNRNIDESPTRVGSLLGSHQLTTEANTNFYQPAFVNSVCLVATVRNFFHKNTFFFGVKNLSVFCPNQFRKTFQTFVDVDVGVAAQPQIFTDVDLNNLGSGSHEPGEFRDENFDRFLVRFAELVFGQTSPVALVGFS